MCTYIVNFHLDYNETYSERRKQLISFFNPPKGYQSDATSTLMLHSSLDTDGFINDLLDNVTLDISDYFLIFQVGLYAQIIKVIEYQDGEFVENLVLLDALKNFRNPFE